ncbi:MAG: hypothetical protein MR681_04805, partial [Prevotella sp.]|nr:hypothetical protein [Prevotella sp.]
FVPSECWCRLMSSTTEWLTSQKILARVEVEITCTDSFAKAVCLAASTLNYSTGKGSTLSSPCHN